MAPLKWVELGFMGNWKASDKRFWLVTEGEQPVARMGVQIHQHQGTSRLHFGFFECFERAPQAAELLFEAAHEFAPDLEIHGPYNFHMEDPYTGVLVQGFEYDPTFLVSYNPPYYDEYLKSAGLEQVMDLYSYNYQPQHVRLDRMEKRAHKAAELGVTIREMDNSRQGEEMRSCIEIADIAWEDNWGFETFQEQQIKDLIMFCRVFFDPAGILFAEHQGRDVGFAWVLRNFNELLKPAKGRLTLRLLWDFLTKRKSISTYRGYALGVLPDCRHLNVPAALVNNIMNKAHRFPWESLEVSWIVASNVKMNAMARALGGRHHKTHRLYRRLPQ